jgi:23S rRNA A1618 N6-methylase RlmF
MRFAKCHPEKLHAAKNLCSNCYNKHLRVTNSEYRKRCLKSSRLARSKPPGKISHKNAILKQRYGITLADKEKMFKDQNGKCKICLKAKKLVVEHCHKTKKVRGLTCNWCNNLITQMETVPNILEAAKNYLAKSMEE